MSQLSFRDANLKLYDSKKREKILEKIEKEKVSTKLLLEIRKDYYDHLSKPHGTPENYTGYHPDVIAAVRKHFPHLINSEEEEALNKKKIQFVMKMLSNLIENPKNLSPQMLKIYLDLLKSSESASDFIVDASLHFSGGGVKTKAEEKTGGEQ